MDFVVADASRLRARSAPRGLRRNVGRFRLNGIAALVDSAQIPPRECGASTRPKHEENVMNVVSRKLLSTSVFVLVAATASVASAAPVDCAKPPDRGEARACEAAAKGVAELRQFIQRTRAIYNLYILDFDRAVAAYAANEQQRPPQPKVA
jgi:hypothetical protein